MRLIVVRIIYFLIIFVITLRLAYWQIIRADDLAAMGEGQRLVSREMSGLRGEVLFSDSSVLATNQPSYLVFVEPYLIKQKINLKGTQLKMYLESYAQKIAQVFWEIDHSNEIVEDETKKEQLRDLEALIYQKLNKDLSWVSLGRKINQETKERLEKLELPGLGFDQSSSRLYPEGSSSAHLLGFVAADNYGDDKGYFGLEGFYDGELRGKKGLLTQEKDALGIPILIGKFFSKKPKNGKTLMLNVDRSVQYIVEEKIKSGLIKYGAKSASALVMDPKTGTILAMASFPNYDPGNVLDYPKEDFKNPIIADGYEPGSTFKVLVMAAAINEEVVKADTVCDSCSGPVSVGGYQIRTWNNKYQDNLTMADTIIHSDNTGMVFVAKKLGLDKFYSYIEKFGFGSPTGVDLQDEYSPAVREKEDWKEIDQATASFGQGISVTALQVVRAVSAIANGGKLMEPHVVSSIKNNDDFFLNKPRVIAEVIKQEAADIIKEMMIQAVDKGEAQFYKKKLGVQKYKIAGKTGTAQIPVAGHYDASKTIASFVGFAPADDPKFVMLVRFDQPSSSIYGADTAAPTFFEISKELFTYYGIPPSE